MIRAATTGRMRSKVAMIVVCAAVVAQPSIGRADIKFSIDPASPAISGILGPDDVLINGPLIFT